MQRSDVVGAFACGAMALLSLAAPVAAQCPSAVSCFVIHPSPGCTDGDCCNAICAGDPFCCVNQWDGVCVEQAIEMCSANVIVGPVVHPTNQNKYYILAATPWSSAQAAASSLGGHLVSIADQAENAWVLNMVLANGQPANYWTGLNDKLVEGTFIWVGGQAVSYTSWGPGQPDNFNGIEDAVHVYTTAGQWNDSHSTAMRISVAEVEVYFCGDPDGESCFAVHTRPYCNDEACCEPVCEYDPECCSIAWDAQCVAAANALCLPPSQVAGPMVNPATGRRHALLRSASWSAAKTLAESLGGTLVTIRSHAENEFVRRTFGNSVPGMGTKPVWIGLSDVALEGSFAWASGSTSTFTNWQLGEPNDVGNEDFVELANQTGQWNDLSSVHFRAGVTEVGSDACGSGGSCFAVHGPGCAIESCCNVVCEVDPFCCAALWDIDCVSAATARCAASVVSGPVVHPATKRSYYVLSSGAWSEAEKFANELGGHLAVPSSAAENAWITANFLQTGLAASPYIGIHDQLVENAFRAVDAVGQFGLVYAAWASGEPNNLNGEDVVQMLASGLWNDTSRFGQRQAIIEVPCVGDLNGNGAVDATDLAVLLGAWGSGTAADLNLDGVVNATDLALVLGAWGPCATSDCCDAHGSAGCDQPGCTQCVCEIDPFCCGTQWDAICAGEAADECLAACQCTG